MSKAMCTKTNRLPALPVCVAQRSIIFLNVWLIRKAQNGQTFFCLKCSAGAVAQNVEWRRCSIGVCRKQMAQQDVPEQRRRGVPPRDQQGLRWDLWNENSKMAAGGAFRVTVQKCWGCLGKQGFHRRVQCYAFQMNGFVESCHVLAVMWIHGLSVGTSCRGAEGGAHRSCKI